MVFAFALKELIDFYPIEG